VNTGEKTVILELFLVLAGLAMIFFIASIGLILARRNAVVPLVIAGLLLLTSGTVIAAEGLAIQSGECEMCEEDSEYWNCSVLNHTCSGVPLQDACNAYPQAQCQAISTSGINCTWTPPLCIGTPDWTCGEIGAWGHEQGYGHDKCTETSGCTLTNELIQGECDRINKNCTTERTYTNYTGNIAPPDNEIDILYYGLILSGIFLILWGAVHAWEQKEPFHREDED